MHSQSRLRVNEAQLVALSLKARASPDHAGWVKKKSGDGGVQVPGSPRWQKRWLVLHRNILYYFESETSQRPQGVIFVEQCDCRRVDYIVESPPVRRIATITTICKLKQFNFISRIN